MIVYCTVRWSRKGTDYHCHCEPVRTLVWQSVLQRLRFLSFSVQSARAKGETDCHVAALLAMTVVDETLAHKVVKCTMLIKADNHNDHLHPQQLLTPNSTLLTPHSKNRTPLSGWECGFWGYGQISTISSCSSLRRIRKRRMAKSPAMQAMQARLLQGSS